MLVLPSLEGSIKVGLAECFPGLSGMFLQLRSLPLVPGKPRQNVVDGRAINLSRNFWPGIPKPLEKSISRCCGGLSSSSYQAKLSEQFSDVPPAGRA